MSRKRTSKKSRKTIIGYKPKKGTLSKYGYHDVKHLTLTERRAALRKAVKSHSALTVFRKLNLVAVYNKSHPTLQKKYIADRNWVRKTYSGQFKSSKKAKKRSKKTRRLKKSRKSSRRRKISH